jgi:hypothetical protein
MKRRLLLCIAMVFISSFSFFSCDLILAAAVEAAGGHYQPHEPPEPWVLKLIAPDAEAWDAFGSSVAATGDYAIVGAVSEDEKGNDAGAAYIFHRTAGVWDSGIKILAPDGEPLDHFGASVAIRGDYAIVGADYEDAGDNASGAAYIYYRTGINAWDAGTKIVASDPGYYNQFGYSVSICGDYAIVGAPYAYTVDLSAGAVYIFQRTGTNTWDTGTKVVPSDAHGSDWFGISAAICGDYAIAGAYGADNGSTNSGAAYVFRRTGSNTWDAGTKILAPLLRVYEDFGRSVDINGDYAIAGSDGAAAYLYHRTGTNTWGAGTKIVAPNELSSFGRSVRLYGDYAAVGTGVVFVYHRTGTTTWSSGKKAAKPDAGAESVAISEDLAIAGVPDDSSAGTGAGAVFLTLIP